MPIPVPSGAPPVTPANPAITTPIPGRAVLRRRSPSLRGT
jgi:hypothetical protein